MLSCRHAVPETSSLPSYPVPRRAAGYHHAVENNAQKANDCTAEHPERIAVNSHYSVPQTEVVVFKHRNLETERENNEQCDTNCHETDLLGISGHAFPPLQLL